MTNRTPRHHLGNQCLIDRSARWGIIKKNTAARYKSRLTARLKAIA